MIADGNLRHYLLYAIGEILLIMVGILLALQLNTIKDRRGKRADELVVYHAVADQIRNYREIIEKDLIFNQGFLVQFEYAGNIIERQDRGLTDTLGKIARNLTDYSDFDGIGNIYETLVNSGEIKLLGNAGIVEELRGLEERFLHINRIENIHYEAIITHVLPSIKDVVKFSTGEVQKPDKLYQTEFQNLILLLLKVMREKDDAYRLTLRKIDRITGLIEEELAR